MTRLVLVHGAFAGAWCWEPVLPGLRGAGHDPQAIDLPGSGADETPVGELSMDAYAARIGETLAEGEPAVLVGHSMGGISVTQAGARWPERVIGLVYVAAFAPADGQSLADLVSYPEAAGDQVQANLVVEGDPPVGTLSAEAAHHALLNCCTPEQLDWALPRLGPQAIAPFEHRVSVPEDHREAFGRLPRAYVLCHQDHAIPPQMQRRMLADAGCEPVIELDTDHSPWISRPDGLVEGLKKIIASLTR
jgi:pimeloyl-ACP methyl ester carboxylesterase